MIQIVTIVLIQTIIQQPDNSCNHENKNQNHDDNNNIHHNNNGAYVIKL